MKAPLVSAGQRWPHWRGVQSGMTPTPPAVSSPSPAAAPEAITETQAFTRAWVLFFVLFLVVIGILWGLKAHFG